MIRMPGTSYRGPLPPATDELLRLGDQLQRDVFILAGEIGPRNVWELEGLRRAEQFIEGELAQAGYEVHRQSYSIEGEQFHNLEVELPGRLRPDEIVIIGAHYDSVDSSPAANDNASGVAATLALARHFARQPAPQRTLRFVLFVNEEPPWFQTEQMGSWVYARRSQQRGERIVAMVSLETIGYYSDQPGSQQYPFPFGLFYPSTGDFIAFVGNYGSRQLVRRAVGAFRNSVQFPSEGGAPPGNIPGVSWSDHWSFWQHGYPAIMVTDTAPFRYPHYHRPSDTPDRLDYDRTSRVVWGLKGVVEELVTVVQDNSS